MADQIEEKNEKIIENKEYFEQTYTLCKEGCDFSGLQEALDNLGAKDTLVVKSGLYEEEFATQSELYLSKSLSEFEPQGSTLSTPLFDLSIQSKTDQSSDRDIAITLIVFFAAVLTILGYLIFGYIVRRKYDNNQKKDL